VRRNEDAMKNYSLLQKNSSMKFIRVKNKKATRIDEWLEKIL